MQLLPLLPPPPPLLLLLLLLLRLLLLLPPPLLQLGTPHVVARVYHAFFFGVACPSCNYRGDRRALSVAPSHWGTAAGSGPTTPRLVPPQLLLLRLLVLLLLLVLHYYCYTTTTTTPTTATTTSTTTATTAIATTTLTSRAGTANKLVSIVQSIVLCVFLLLLSHEPLFRVSPKSKLVLAPTDPVVMRQQILLPPHIFRINQPSLKFNRASKTHTVPPGLKKSLLANADLPMLNYWILVKKPSICLSTCLSFCFLYLFVFCFWLSIYLSIYVPPLICRTGFYLFLSFFLSFFLSCFLYLFTSCFLACFLSFLRPCESSATATKSARDLTKASRLPRNLHLAL